MKEILSFSQDLLLGFDAGLSAWAFLLLRQATNTMRNAMAMQICYQEAIRSLQNSKDIS